MDHLRTGAVLRRGGQRAPVGEARRVERPALPHAARRGQGAFSCRNTSCPRSAASAPDCRSWSRSIVLGHIPLESGETAYGTLRSVWAATTSPRTPRGVPGNRAGDLERRLRHDHLHLGHDGRSQRRDPDAPQLHGQRRAVARAHRHPAVLPHAHHPAARPLFRPRRGILHHDRLRRHGGHRADRPRRRWRRSRTYRSEHPRSAAALPAVGSGAGQEFPQKHRMRRSAPRAACTEGAVPAWRCRTAYAYNGDGYGRGQRLAHACWRPVVSTVRRRCCSARCAKPSAENCVSSSAGERCSTRSCSGFFYAVGMPMFQGYGLSEATPVISTNSPRHHWHRFGSSGTLVQSAGPAASSTRRVARFLTVRKAKSSSAARMSWPVTGKIPRRRPTPCATAGSIRATWATCLGGRISSMCWDVSKAC